MSSLSQLLSNKFIVGVSRGAAYGLLGGCILGGVGALSTKTEVDINFLNWTNRHGKSMRFTNAAMISEMKDDLVTVASNKSYNVGAFNEAFRNIQSVLALGDPIERGVDDPTIMTARRMTNFVVRASKALEAIHEKILEVDVVKSHEFEKAMMNITLTLEEKINVVRTKSKNVLPNISP